MNVIITFSTFLCIITTNTANNSLWTLFALAWVSIKSILATTISIRLPFKVLLLITVQTVIILLALKTSISTIFTTLSSQIITHNTFETIVWRLLANNTLIIASLTFSILINILFFRALSKNISSSISSNNYQIFCFWRKRYSFWCCFNICINNNFKIILVGIN